MMIKTTTRRVPPGLCSVSTILVFLAATAAAQTSATEQIKGTATSTTALQHGTVTYVEGNTLVIKMSTGEVRTLTVPDSRTAMVDGKEITVHDLKVGTTLTATITTTTIPVTDRTVTNLTGTVWFVSGSTVILTLPDGKNKMYKSLPGFKFTVDGRQATVFDLRKGMRISAEKVVEQPTTEISSNTVVTGHAPPPKVVAQAPAPAPVQAATPAPAPVPVAAAPAPEPAPEPTPAPLPAELPTTASPMPLVGLLGLLFTGAGLSLGSLRRFLK
jgi:hypothetical protein